MAFVGCTGADAQGPGAPSVAALASDEEGPSPLLSTEEEPEEVPDQQDPIPADTEGRTRWLENFARASLVEQSALVEQEILWRGGVPTPLTRAAGQPGSAGYAIRVGGDRQGCFSDSLPNSSAPPRDLSRDTDMDTMRSQIGYVVGFLAHVHESLGGLPNIFFDTVMLCPEVALGDSLLLRGRELVVAVPEGDEGSEGLFGARLPQELVDMWTLGEQFSQLDEQSPLRKYWSFLDPIGLLQVTTRNAIKSYLLPLIQELSRWLEGEDVALADIIATHVMEAVEGYDDIDFRQWALDQVTNLDPGTLRELVQRWLSFVADERNVEDLVQGVMAAPFARSSYRINLHQECEGLAVGNFHNINVDLSLFLPGAERFAPFVDGEVIQHEINVRQTGLVCVYTIDEVGVTIGVSGLSFRRSLTSVGLEQAIGSLLNS
jgi:hypothetical protein